MIFLDKDNLLKTSLEHGYEEYTENIYAEKVIYTFDKRSCGCNCNCKEKKDCSKCEKGCCKKKGMK